MSYYHNRKAIRRLLQFADRAEHNWVCWNRESLRVKFAKRLWRISDDGESILRLSPTLRYYNSYSSNRWARRSFKMLMYATIQYDVNRTPFVPLNTFDGLS